MNCNIKRSSKLRSVPLYPWRLFLQSLDTTRLLSDVLDWSAILVPQARNGRFIVHKAVSSSSLTSLRTSRSNFCQRLVPPRKKWNEGHEKDSDVKENHVWRRTVIDVWLSVHTHPPCLDVSLCIVWLANETSFLQHPSKCFAMWNSRPPREKNSRTCFVTCNRWPLEKRILARV